MQEIDFRPASLNDAECLFAWRNDPLTRAASHDERPLDLETHLAWLEQVLQDPERSLWIVEMAGQPVGTLRTDREGDVQVLSWTVAPEVRGQGVGKRMVGRFVSQLEGRLRAEVRVGNAASSRIAEASGLILAEEKAGVRYYVRDVP